MEISVVLPAYQEAGNLKMILPKIQDTLNGIEHEIIVVDTMETMDDTSEVCKKFNAICIPRRGGNSYGDAIRTGFEIVNSKYTVVMDADGSHDPQAILTFYEEMLMDKYDLIIGSRYCKGGKSDNSAILIFMSWALNVTYRLFFSLKVKDVSDSFRMYRSEQIKNLEIECQNFDVVEEILIKLNLMSSPLRIKEIPISFNKREEGKSKRDLVKFIISYFSTIKRLLCVKKKMKNVQSCSNKYCL